MEILTMIFSSVGIFLGALGNTSYVENLFNFEKDRPALHLFPPLVSIGAFKKEGICIERHKISEKIHLGNSRTYCLLLIAE